MQVVENLTSMERELLNEHLLKLRHGLDPGFAYLNWTSLGILDFVAAAVKVCRTPRDVFFSLVPVAAYIMQQIASESHNTEQPGC